MDSELVIEPASESPSDQDIEETKDELLVRDFKMDFDEGENDLLEEKPVVYPTGTDGENKCFENAIKEEIEHTEENIKPECIDENDEQHQKFIKYEDLVIKHEKDDLDETGDVYNDEPGYVDVCSECTVIVSVNDNPVPMGIADRAGQTVPKGTLALRSSKANSLGIYSRRHLKKGVRMGPYEGHTIKVESNDKCTWKVSEGKLVDECDETTSNYLRYVNYAKDASEQNLMPVQYKGELYYQTCRAIEKGEELLIHFGGNQNKTYYEPIEENFDEESYTCQFCQLGMKYESHRDRHQMFCQFRTDDGCDGSLCIHFSNANDSEHALERTHTESVESRKKYETYSEGIFCKHGSKHCQEKVFNCEDCEMTQKHNEINMFKCTHCNYKTISKLKLSKHQLKHETNMLKSTDCNETYSESNLKMHKMKHDKKKALKCPDCDFETYYKESLATHKQTHSLINDQRKVLKCTDCDYETYFKSSLNAHRRKHNQTTLFKCAECDFETCYKRSLSVHKQTHSLINMFKCTHCNYETNTSGNFRTHKMKHNEKNLLKCTDCDFETYYKSSLKLHQEKHNSTDVFKYTHRDYKTISRLELSKHQLKHETNMLKTTDCNYETHSKSNLKRHKTEHGQKKALRCKDCDFENCYKHSLINVFKCTHCSYETNTSWNFRNHEMKHNPKNLLKCTDCDYETYYKSSLKMHQEKRNQTDVFKCVDCDFKTCYKHNLNMHHSRMHKMRHDQKNPLKCADCDYKTYYKSRLNIHRQIHYDPETVSKIYWSTHQIEHETNM